jgi:hypothetical protein
MDEQDRNVCGDHWDVFDGDECGLESLVSTWSLGVIYTANILLVS